MNRVTILIVDDEIANQFLFEGLLSEHGYSTLFASSGTECLEMLKNNVPQLILLDVMMPNMNGMALLEILKKDENWKYIPVIMVSAKISSSDVEEALEKGAVDYIRKPFDEMELIARVRSGIRLKEYQDKLRGMVNLRNDFVKIISHDLRNPFTTIQGFAEKLLEAENLTDKQRLSLEYIIKTVEFSDDYFDKLLSWTLIHHGNFKLEFAEQDLAELIEGILHQQLDKVREKELKLKNELTPGIKLSLDPTFFRQAVTNLLSNAIKFTPRYGRIKFSVSRDDSGLALIISDSGVGMPAGFNIGILDKDSIVSSRKGTDGEMGTGIGLGICKKILDAHNFRLDFAGNMMGGTDSRIFFS